VTIIGYAVALKADHMMLAMLVRAGLHHSAAGRFVLRVA